MCKNDENCNKKSEKNTYKLLGKKVCTKFFLNTLSLKTFIKINKLLKKLEISQNFDLNELLKDKRLLNGRRKSQEFVGKFESFIESYDPKPSHYRLSNAPKRKYIDSENNTKLIKLYKEFVNQMNFKPI